MSEAGYSQTPRRRFCIGKQRRCKKIAAEKGSADEILDLLGELRRTLEKTIVLVAHDPRAAARVDRVLHLEKGRLVETA